MAEYAPHSMEMFRLYACIPHDPWGNRIHYHDCVTSTNDLAKELAENGAPHGTVVLADAQTGGRGRMGRSFCSPGKKGIYLSVVLRPNCRPTELMHLTCAVAVSVRDSIVLHLNNPMTDNLVRIKWINDIVLDRKKIGGILTEMSLDSKTGLVRYVVIGIGINYYSRPEDFPPELRNIACSIATFFGTQRMNNLIGRILYDLEEMDRKLLTEKSAIMDRYRQYCMTIGQEVSIHGFDTVRHGTAVDVDDNGALLVRFPHGSMEAISAGEVSVRGMYGYV